MKTAKQILTWLAMPVFLFSFILLISVVYQRVSGKPVPTLFGCGMAAVKTGSMEPAIPAGSLIVIQEQDSYQPGDVVTYEGSGHIFLFDEGERTYKDIAQWLVG